MIILQLLCYAEEKFVLHWNDALHPEKIQQHSIRRRFSLLFRKLTELLGILLVLVDNSTFWWYSFCRVEYMI
jgi:hypothetical protein